MVISKYTDFLKLFPHFKEPCVIAVANLKDSQKRDPEDFYAAKAILKRLVDIQGSDEKVKIKNVPLIGAIESDKHLISLGGWAAPNKNISYLPSYSDNMPHRELYLNIDPEMADKKVSRRFLGKQKEKSLRAVWDRRLGRDGKICAETDPKGWLTKDYLLISTFHLKCLIPSVDKSLFVTSFEGLYGPGTMAVELFFRDFDKKLKEPIFKVKGDNPCFQILCSAGPIDHSGDFSYAEDIDFVRAYAITESQESSKVSKERGEEVKDFVVYSPTSTGIGTDISEISEQKIRKDYLQKRNDYSLFIYTRNSYVKVGKELKPIDQVDERIYKLLVIFLRQKDMLIPPIPLYRKAWADSPLKITNIQDERDVSPHLKTAISELRSLLKDVPDFEITKARQEGYVCKGKFRFCVIIPKSKEKKYILSEAEEEENHSL